MLPEEVPLPQPLFQFNHYKEKSQNNEDKFPAWGGIQIRATCMIDQEERRIMKENANPQN